MAQIASVATNKLQGRLAAADAGIPAVFGALKLQGGFSLPAILPHQIVAHNVAPELSERSAASKYPLMYVYCTKMVNKLREKFRVFSGEAHMVVEARVSQDRLEEIDANVQTYVDAITQVLDQSRGDWGDGVFYGGGYEVNFGGVKPGGKNLIQIAKVTFILDISTD